MSPLPDQKITELAVAAGMMPADVEEALAEAASAGQKLPTDADIERQARIDEAHVERTRAWWWFITQVPPEFKRILEARPADQGRSAGA